MRITCFLAFLAGTFHVPFIYSQNSGSNGFYISIYSPPPAPYQNDEQYRIMKDAGIDYIFNIGPGVKSDREGNLRTLDLARRHGLGVYVFDSRISQGDSALAALVADYRNHPALAGFYVTDEPDSARLQSVIALHQKITRLAPGKDAYVNHLPDWAVKNYEHGFMERWIRGAGPENLRYLAYDNYPFKRNQRYEKTYYNNLDIIRRLGLKYHLRTSSCLQSFGMSFNGVEELRRPTPDEMRLNVYSNLAYGVKNPVWYPYWSTYRHTDVITMAPCIIHENGRKTDLYDTFRKLNHEMKQLGKTLSDLEALEVYHTGDSLWTGTAHPPADFVCLPQKAGSAKNDFILSRMADRKSGKNYIMIVNKSHRQPADATFSMADGTRAVREISKVPGVSSTVAYDAAKRLLYARFLPGEGKLYLLNP